MFGCKFVVLLKCVNVCPHVPEANIRDLHRKNSMKNGLASTVKSDAATYVFLHFVRFYKVVI